MGKHRRLQCSSDSSSSDYGVPSNCALGGCQAPFQEIVNIYSVSSIGCDESSCPDRSDGAFSELCESATLSTCPRVEHYVKESKSSTGSSSSSNSSDKTDKHGRCGECKYKRCRCQRGECNYRAILCESSDDCSDSCDSDSDRAFIAPIAGCNNALMQGWSDCTSDSSSDECERCRKPHDKCGCYNCRDCGKKRKDCTCHGKKKYDDKREDKRADKKGLVCSACAYPLNKCKCLDKEVPVKLKGKEYNVKFQPKKGHPWAPRIVSIKNGKTTNVDQAIAIDGVLGKELHLTRGNLYKFNVSQSLLGSTYSFYFTADVQGGPVGEAADSTMYDPVKLPGTPDPVSNGTIFLKADASLPKMFYYQCREQRCMGGSVFIHDK